MADTLIINDFLAESHTELIVDVRSPVEFLKGHVPGAVNIPLFEDNERAEIGLLFKQQGKDSAVSRGLEIVSPKMVSLVNRVKALSKNKKVYVYCFRGGMRSSSFTWLMNTSGLRAKLLKGGYKTYRNYVLHSFEQEKHLVLLGGKTGSGKTGIIRHLSSLSIQTIDLEGLAHHKGSAFGAINEEKQRPQQNFEHVLYEAFRHLNPSQRIVLEDEAKSIGFNRLPHALWLQMKQATIIKLEIPFELRVQQLVDDYATADPNELKSCIKKISQQLGPLHTKLCLQCLEQNNFHEVARLSLSYYDKAYDFQYEKKQQRIIPVFSDTIDVAVNAQKIKQIIDTLN